MAIFCEKRLKQDFHARNGGHPSHFGGMDGLGLPKGSKPLDLSPPGLLNQPDHFTGEIGGFS